MKVFYLPVSSTELSTEALRENMRRWHWRRYFHFLKREAQWLRSEFPGCFALSKEAKQMAEYHRKLAQSIQNTKRL